MAEVIMSKTRMFSSSSSSIHHHHHHHHHHRGHGVSVFPTKSAMGSSGLGFRSLKVGPPSAAVRSSASSLSSTSDFHGRRFLFQGIPMKGNSRSRINAQMSTGLIGKAQKWWEKDLKPNMKEVRGAEDLVESLLNAGDKLVVLDFFSPGCGGCRALHPKLCQIAEMNPEVQFLQVNYEEHKSMCYSLNVHVLPFFRFYRGAQGRLCSFSCTNATIKKFRDALAKHSPDRCSLGPPKGLEEKELLSLAANKDLSFTFTPMPELPVPVPTQEENILTKTTPVLASHSNGEPPVSLPLPFPLPSVAGSNAAHNTEDKNLVASGR